MGTNKNRNAHCHITVFASAAYSDTAWTCFFTAFVKSGQEWIHLSSLWNSLFFFSFLQYVMVIFYWSNKLRFDHNSPYSQSQQPWQVVWGWKCHPKLWARNWMLFFFLKFSLNKWERQTTQVISEWRLILTIIYFQLLFQDSTLT